MVTMSICLKSKVLSHHHCTFHTLGHVVVHHFPSSLPSLSPSLSLSLPFFLSQHQLYHTPKLQIQHLYVSVSLDDAWREKERENCSLVLFKIARKCGSQEENFELLFILPHLSLSFPHSLSLSLDTALCRQGLYKSCCLLAYVLVLLG